MKIFKNPNRGKTKHVVPETYVPETYVPEYKRLDKNPIVLPASREEFRRVPTKKAIPPQVKVNSGQAIDGGWSAVPAVVAKQTPRNIQVKEHFENSFYDEPVSSQAIPDYSKDNIESVDYDQVELPTEIDDTNSLVSNIDFISIQSGECILMYDNDIIASGTIDEITKIVEEVLTSDDYNIDVEKLVVLKKMNLRTGVVISE